MRLAVTLASLALAGCSATTSMENTNQDRDTPGNYKKLAACVYRGLDSQRPGLFQLTDLGDSVDVTETVHGGGMIIRAMRATFTRVSENTTRLHVEGQPPGYFANQVRPLATDCAGKP